MTNPTICLSNEFWNKIEKSNNYNSILKEFQKDGYLKYTPSYDSKKHFNPCYFYNFSLAFLMLGFDDNLLPISDDNQVSLIEYYEAYGIAYRAGQQYFNNNFSNPNPILIKSQRDFKETLRYYYYESLSHDLQNDKFRGWQTGRLNVKPKFLTIDFINYYGYHAGIISALDLLIRKSIVAFHDFYDKGLISPELYKVSDNRVLVNNRTYTKLKNKGKPSPKAKHARDHINNIDNKDEFLIALKSVFSYEDNKKSCYVVLALKELNLLHTSPYNAIRISFTNYFGEVFGAKSNFYVHMNGSDDKFLLQIKSEIIDLKQKNTII